jgi:predicted transcriptional regulator
MQRVYHPNAWLSNFKNVKPGLERRTAILDLLEKQSYTAKHLSKRINITYRTVLYHLHNLERKGIIKRAANKPPFPWKLRSVGQLTLDNY